MSSIEEVVRENDSVTKYVKQAVGILRSAPLRHWPSIALYMVEVVIYRLSKKKLREELALNVYGLNFLVKTHNMDMGIIYEIFNEGVYTTSPDFIPRDGWTCVDVGANIGCVSLAWALHNPHGKIFALEPHPATFERLKRNIAANQFVNVACFNVAADRHSGSLDFLLSDDTSMGVAAADSERDTTLAKLHSRYEDSSGRKSSYKVPARSLDDFYAENNITLVDLLKIDIEGHEVACLEGSTTALQKTRRIILEFHSPALRNACWDILSKAGFSLQETGLLFFATNTRFDS